MSNTGANSRLVFLDRLSLLDAIADNAILISRERHLSISWATAMIIFYGALGLVIGFVAGLYLDSASPMLLGTMLGSLVGYMRHSGPDPKVHVYELLIKYDPINKDAYENLQLLAEDDELNPDAILSWVEQERALASEPAKESEADLIRKRFAATRKEVSA